MRYVQYINLKEMMVVLENEIQLPLSYKYKNSVKEAYQEYKYDEIIFRYYLCFDRKFNLCDVS